MKKNNKKKFDTVKLKNIKIDKKSSSQIIFIIYLFTIIFVGLFSYLIMFQIKKSEELKADYRNPRLIAREKKVIPGNIYSIEKIELAKTEKQGNNYKRVYPQGEIYASIIGYVGNGRSGLEASLYKNLLETPYDDQSFIDKLKNIENESIKNIGNSVVTTLNARMQKEAYDLLGNRKGAIVLMEPKTGKIISMVSKPTFNPNYIKENWEKLSKDTENAPLLNRATQGLYPPGSVFKILTALEYIRENRDFRQFRYSCPGIINKHNLPIACAYNKAHGDVDIYKAMARSCNGAFVEMGLKLNIGKYKELVENFGFNDKLPCDNIQYASSKFLLKEDSSYGEIMHTAFGQGNTLVTPLHNCMIASTIANGGLMMRAQIIDHIEDANHGIITKYIPKEYKTILSPLENSEITKMMQGVVTNGTAQGLNGLNYTVACKTGTAQYNEGKNTHSLIIGFAPVEDPKIAFSIVLEGYEGQPDYDNQLINITRKILNSYFGG